MTNEPDNTNPIKGWRTPSPVPSDHGSERTEYESEELMPRPQKGPRREEHVVPDYDPREDAQVKGPDVEHYEDPNEDAEQ